MTHSGQPDENFEELIEEFMPSDIQGVIKEKEAGEPRKEQTLQEKLNQYPAPQDELNLHNLTSEKAKTDIRNFIEHSRHKGLKTVRIITGKGIHSEEGRSVLRGIAEDKIVELKNEGLVLSYKWEQGKMARSGAMIVYLN